MLHSRQGLKPRSMDAGEAEALAIDALAFVAADAQLLPRFLALSGLEASAVRDAAREPGFPAGVLQFVAAHEPTLLRFAESAGVRPETVEEALRALPFGDDRFDRSA